MGKTLSRSKQLLLLVGLALCVCLPGVVSAETTKSDSVGLQGTISSDPPKVGATISLPTTNQIFTATPITVTGICPANLLVKVYKNNVFGGSSYCSPQGNFSLQIDLFSGTNDLVARVYDALDQAGPDSNTVTVRLNDALGTPSLSRITITSLYAYRGANPNETLRWPFVVSGGTAPYALAIDWGDHISTPVTSSFAGDITATHIYKQPGVYPVIVRITDNKNGTAYLQVVAVVNGQVPKTDSSTASGGDKTYIRYIVWPLLALVPTLVLTFWLATRYENRRLRHLISQGEQPFK